MAYAAVKTAIKNHCVTAGATLTPPLQDVQIGFPLPADRAIRIYYGGETEPVKMGPGNLTLNSELVGKVTIIAAFWAVSTLNTEIAARIDADMEALTHSIRGLINGDAQLGGTTTDSTLEYAEPDIVINGNTRYAMLSWRLVTDYVEYPRAA